MCRKGKANSIDYRTHESPENSDEYSSWFLVMSDAHQVGNTREEGDNHVARIRDLTAAAGVKMKTASGKPAISAGEAKNANEQVHAAPLLFGSG